MHTFTIGTNDAGQRADKFLRKACPQLPTSLLYKTFRKKDVKCDGKRIPPETILHEGAVLQIYLPEDCFTEKAEPAARPKSAARLPKPDIIYEDAQIAVLRKPIGIPVHADDHGTEDTLIARFLRHLIDTGAYRPEEEQSFTPALCNRLDRNTEGFVLAAKTAAALRCMNEKIRNGEIHKQYYCVTVGAPPKNSDVVTAYHKKISDNQVILSELPKFGFREIRTGYQVLAQKNDLSLLQVTLYTGRAHQIRVQMAALGCPILGDPRYGRMDANIRHGQRYQLLSACKLRFVFSEEPCCLSALNGMEFSFVPQFAGPFLEAEH